jgi:hypothetical protein
LVRINISDYSKKAEKEFDRACKLLQRAAPDVLATIRLHSRRETRLLLRDNKLTERNLLPGAVHSMTVPPAILEAPDRYAVKLAKAFHYFHARSVLPTSAAVKVKVLTNAEAFGATYLDGIFRR